jgi:hypothetical protein
MNPDELRQKFDEAVQAHISNLRIYTDKNVDYKKIFEDLNDALVAIAVEAAPQFLPATKLDFVEEDLPEGEVEEVEVYEDYMFRVDNLSEEDLAKGYLSVLDTHANGGTLTPEEAYLEARWNSLSHESATLLDVTAEARDAVGTSQHAKGSARR